ncbi:MAG: hypothetical protein RL199_1121, partial [Pseudomonadota bacterium]
MTRARIAALPLAAALAPALLAAQEPAVEEVVVVDEDGSSAPALPPVTVAADEVVRVPEVQVLGRALKDGVGGSTPGAGEALEREAIEKARPASVNELLRQLPGVMVRDEEGLGLRPNIGLRGLDPTRSGKVLLLEDGIPLG